MQDAFHVNFRVSLIMEMGVVSKLVYSVLQSRDASADVADVAVTVQCIGGRRVWARVE